MIFLGNLSSSDNGSYTSIASPFSSYTKSFNFSSPSDYQLTDIQVDLYVADTVSTSINASLYGNGVKITDLDFSTAAFTAGESNYVLLPTVLTYLHPGISYSFDLSGYSDFSNGAFWVGSNTSPSGSAQFGDFYLNGSPSSLYNKFQIDATPVVPFLGSFNISLVFAFLFLFCYNWLKFFLIKR